VAYDNNDKKMESVYSKRIRAGKRRTYFFDVRATRSNDYYLTITESRKRFNENGYDRHKIFLYKEDFNKFVKALSEAVDYVKTDLMPDFDFDAFNHDNDNQDGYNPDGYNNHGEGEYSGSNGMQDDGHEQVGSNEQPAGEQPIASNYQHGEETEAELLTPPVAATTSQTDFDTNISSSTATEEVDKW
jgi:Protein of unknown function (DUF3276)